MRDDTRRTFVAGLAAGLLPRPHWASAQAVPRKRRVAVLVYPRRPEGFPLLDSLIAGLREAGWVDGWNIIVELHYAERLDDLPRAAAALVGSKPDVIVAAATPNAIALKQATETIPIVTAAAADSVGAGLVASLARPGGNVTGLTLATSDIQAKRLQLLKEAVPAASHVAYVPNTGVRGPANAQWIREGEAAAQVLGLRLTVVDLGSDPGAWDRRLAVAVRDGVNAMTVMESSVIFTDRKTIAELALRHRLPGIFAWRQAPEAGCLMSYGANVAAIFHRAATFVDKILKGAKPADLPVEQPTQFELVINLKTAKALGLTIPPSLLLRADRVIE